MPDMLRPPPESMQIVDANAGPTRPASNDRRKSRPRSGQDAEDHRLGIVGHAVLDLGRARGAHADHRAGDFERHPGQRVVGIEHDLVLGDVGAS